MDIPIDKIKIGYNEWNVYKINNLHYEYSNFPFSIGADREYRIIVKYDIIKGYYDFDFKEYFEIYGSGGWNEWKNCDKKTKNIILEDVINRVKKPNKRNFTRFDIMDLED